MHDAAFLRRFISRRLSRAAALSAASLMPALYFRRYAMLIADDVIYLRFITP